MHSAQKRKRIALLGGTEHECDATHKYLKKRFNGLNIVFCKSGYFPNEQTDNMLSELLLTNPDIIIIGMGTPRQEITAIRLKSLTTRPMTIFTCGGFITQTAIGGDYYPPIIKKTGTRWIYRTIKEPHVRKRVVVDYPRFLLQVVSYYFHLVWKGR